jgi:hypothetical protein
MKKAALGFETYPEDPLERRQFELRLLESALSWAREATDIYIKALTDTGNLIDRVNARVTWQNGLSDFVTHRIMPQVEVALNWGDQDQMWLEYPWDRIGIRSIYMTQAQAKADALSRILADVRKRTLAASWWIPAEQGDSSIHAIAQAVTPPGNLNTSNDSVFRCSEDYGTVRYQGKDHILTPNQSSMMRVLHEAYLKGFPDVEKLRLLAAIENEESQVKDSWKGSPLWQTLIVSSARRGRYRLNLPAVATVNQE